MSIQAGDVPLTIADINELIKSTGLKPATSIEDGTLYFVRWYHDFYQKNMISN